jgi:histidinol-phosphate aminotransferase
VKASDLVRADIAAMEPYVPVVPFEVLAERLDRSSDQIVKLNANENPYGPSPRVRADLASLAYPHIYPDPASSALRAALSTFTGIGADYLLAGAGADELIDLLCRLFLQPSDAVLDCPPTFAMYRFDASLCGAVAISVPRRCDFVLDLHGIETAVNQHRPKLIFVASPNNPDGGWLSDEDLERLLELPLVVVLDEAYVEFAAHRGTAQRLAGTFNSCRSRMDWVPQRHNLVVLRTFSKWAGLAGLRVGYGAFPSCILPDLWKIKQPYGVSQAASTAAVAALGDLTWAEDKISLLVQERLRLFGYLQEIPYLSPYPSLANFVLCRVLGRDAAELVQALEREGILLRHYSSVRLRDHVRISVGKPEHTDALLSALRRL